MKLNIEEHDLDMILMGYLRYSMGRMTYMVPHCCATLSKYIPKMDIARQKWFVHEIERELERYERNNAVMGMPCDHKMWQDLVKNLQVHIDENE